MESKPNRFGRRALAVVSSFVAISAMVVTLTWLLQANDDVMAQTGPTPTDQEYYSSAADFRLEDCTLKSRGDENEWHFPLIPGHTFVMEGEEDGVALRKETEVLHETEKFNLPGLGKFKARVVEERDFEDGEFIQVSRFWYAICEETSAVYIFGEEAFEVDPDTGELLGINPDTGRPGSTWRAGDPDFNGIQDPGMHMPGTLLLGARYLFEAHEGFLYDTPDGVVQYALVAGAEVVETGMTVTVPAGTFFPCGRIIEQGITNPADILEKVWCAGVGLVSEPDGELTEFTRRGEDRKDGDRGD